MVMTYFRFRITMKLGIIKIKEIWNVVYVLNMPCNQGILVIRQVVINSSAKLINNELTNFDTPLCAG